MTWVLHLSLTPCPPSSLAVVAVLRNRHFFGSSLVLLPANNHVGYKTIIESYHNHHNKAIYFIS